MNETKELYASASAYPDSFTPRGDGPYGLPTAQAGAASQRYHSQKGRTSQYNYGMPPPRPRSKWHPKSWSRLTWIIMCLGVLVLVIVVVVAAVVPSEIEDSHDDDAPTEGPTGEGQVFGSGPYPNYAPLEYSLTTIFSGPSFFDQFVPFTDKDPSQGFVTYVDAPTASPPNLNLTFASADSAVLRVDSTTASAPQGRNSVRITSSAHFNDGLFIFDVLHTPTGCGTWPSVWLGDPSAGAASGIIDVIQGVNAADTGNIMGLHTSADCSMATVQRKQIGDVLGDNCVDDTGLGGGCRVQGVQGSFGTSFNDNGGGVFALELRSEGIRSWFFARDSIPGDIDVSPRNDTSIIPDPSTWGDAMADFPATACDVPSHFTQLNIVVDIDLCSGSAVGQGTFGMQDGCPSDCQSYVADNAGSFTDAYWEFGTFKVYETLG